MDTGVPAARQQAQAKSRCLRLDMARKPSGSTPGAVLPRIAPVAHFSISAGFWLVSHSCSVTVAPSHVSVQRMPEKLSLPQSLLQHLDLARRTGWCAGRLRSPDRFGRLAPEAMSLLGGRVETAHGRFPRAVAAQVCRLDVAESMTVTADGAGGGHQVGSSRLSNRPGAAGETDVNPADGAPSSN